MRLVSQVSVSGQFLVILTSRAMSVIVDVSLISGRTVTLEATADERVEALKRSAQTALGVGGGQLLNSSGSVLDGAMTVKKAKLRSGDSLTFQIRGVQVCSSEHAVAAILGDGSVVTWGAAEYGGDCSSVQSQLKNVQQIQASYRAFAAILDDGSVVTWGDADEGGDSSAVQDQLKPVKRNRNLWLGLCCGTGKRICYCLGRCEVWRGLQFRARPASSCPTGPGLPMRPLQRSGTTDQSLHGATLSMEVTAVPYKTS